MGSIFEDVEDVFVIGALRRGGQAQGEFGRKIGQDLLICISGGVVGPVYDDVAEIVRLEIFQIQSHTLDATANHEGIPLFHTLHIATHSSFRPQLSKSFCSLLHQLHGVSQKQRAFAESFGVHDGGHCLAGTCCVVEKGDGLKAMAHFLQRIQCLLLVLL